MAAKHIASVSMLYRFLLFPAEPTSSFAFAIYLCGFQLVRDVRVAFTAGSRQTRTQPEVIEFSHERDQKRMKEKLRIIELMNIIPETHFKPY
jgi:hypothetical protein